MARILLSAGDQLNVSIGLEYLKLFLKSTLSSTILLVHINNGTSQFMSHHTGVSTSDVVTQGIMDEGILILKKAGNSTLHQYSICII